MISTFPFCDVCGAPVKLDSYGAYLTGQGTIERGWVCSFGHINKRKRDET